MNSYCKWPIVARRASTVQYFFSFVHPIRLVSTEIWNSKGFYANTIDCNKLMTSGKLKSVWWTAVDFLVKRLEIDVCDLRKLCQTTQTFLLFIGIHCGRRQHKAVMVNWWYRHFSPASLLKELLPFRQPYYFRLSALWCDVFFARWCHSFCPTELMKSLR